MPSYIYKCPNQDCSLLDIEKDITKKMLDPAPTCECSTEMVQVFKHVNHVKLIGDGWTGSDHISTKLKD